MTLKELARKYNTDKNTTHSYIDHLYENLFAPLKNNVEHILEIGVLAGGSLCLWRDYFSNAIVHGVDINPYFRPPFDDNRIKVYHGDAYDSNFIDSLTNDSFDLIIDDGPHTLQSMRIFVSKYLSKVKHTGYLVLEDIQDISWVDDIKLHIDQSIPNNVVLHDLRSIKNRYDDIVLVIQKI